MKTTIETFKSQIVRKAIVFDIGGFRPPNDPLSSWFGKVTSGGKGEVWPSLIQSEIFWAPWNKHDAVPDYVFQIDTTRKGGWMWGDHGVGYFGRGTASGKKNEWTLEWQCY